jgi:flagellar protein FlaG
MNIQVVAAIQGPPPAPAIGPHQDEKAIAPSTTRASEKPNESEPSVKALQEAVNTIKDAVRKATDTLDFSIDADSGRTVIKVIDNSTNEVIRQFPSKEALEIAQAIDKLHGLLLEEKA